MRTGSVEPDHGRQERLAPPLDLAGRRLTGRPQASLSSRLAAGRPDENAWEAAVIAVSPQPDRGPR